MNLLNYTKMNYFVIAPDGQKYGPADVQTLNHWAQEGRVLATSMLEDAVTGTRIPATSVSGINFPLASTGAQNFQQPNYQYGPGQMYADDGSADVKKVWLFGGLAFIPCCAFPLVFGILAVVFATNSQKKGNPQGNTAMIFAICSLVGGLLFSFFIRAIGAGIFSSMR